MLPKLCRILALTLISTPSGAQTRVMNSAPRPVPQTLPNQGAEVLRLRPYSVKDTQLGIEAFRILIPADWKLEGGVAWRANPTRPATVSIRIYNPNGMEEIGAVPDIQCVWAVTLPAFGFSARLVVSRIGGPSSHGRRGRDAAQSDPAAILLQTAECQSRQTGVAARDGKRMG